MPMWSNYSHVRKQWRNKYYVINLDHDGFKSGIQWLFQVMMNVENTIIQSTIEPKILYLNHRKIKFE